MRQIFAIPLFSYLKCFAVSPIIKREEILNKKKWFTCGRKWICIKKDTRRTIGIAIFVIKKSLAEFHMTNLNIIDKID